MSWLDDVALPGDETRLAWQLSLAASLLFIPAVWLAMGPHVQGWELVILAGIAGVLVLLTGTTGSYFWFLGSLGLALGPLVVDSGDGAGEVARMAVVGSLVLVTMECLRLAHVARRSGRIRPEVVSRVAGSTGLVIAVMVAVGIGASAFAGSRTFPAWLLLTAIVLGSFLLFAWGRSLSFTAQEAGEYGEHGDTNPLS